MKKQGAYNRQDNSEKEQGGFTILNFKTYFKASVIEEALSGVCP